MRKFLVVVSSVVCWLGLGVSHAQEQQKLDPATIVARGAALAREVALAKKCEHSTKVTDLRKPDSKAKDSKDDNEKADKLSLPIMFTEGRYSFVPEVRDETLDDLPVWVMDFKPLADEAQLKPEPGASKDSKNYSKAMSNMEGSVYVDPKTGGVVKVTAGFAKRLWFRADLGVIPVLVPVDKAVVVINQKLVDDTWLPTQVTLEVWAPLTHDLYTTKFTCAAEK